MHRASFYAVIGLVVACINLYTNYAYAHPMHMPHWTEVENKFLIKSGRQQSYPGEFAAVIEVRNPYELGKLTALRFIEWVQYNPNGVVAFTSGNTPEFFVKFLDFYKNNWHKPKVQAELHSMGIKSKNFPDTSNLKLVQIEEIYPMVESHYKKISNYIRRHYVKILKIKPENLLLMDVSAKGILAEKGMNVVFMNGKVDLSIMNREPSSQLENWQQQAINEVSAFCSSYENKIRAWGGIDFFIGGISYGGPLGFIEPGSSPELKTHYTKLDYSTAAHAAKDLGGIEHSRGKIAITIGPGTITFNRNAILIILASGEAKAPVVRDAIQNKLDMKYPATLVQKYPNSRFYITDGAAKLLDARYVEDIRFKSKHGWIQKHVSEVIIGIALAEGKQILSLTEADFNKHESGKLLLDCPPKPFATMLLEVHEDVVKKIEAGLKLTSNKLSKNNKILHTAPHHDDIMLGYYPLFDRLSSKYKNYFSYFTSGSNSVSDGYILATINRASDWWLDKEQDTILRKPYDKVIARFRGYFVKQDFEQIQMLETTLAMRHLVSVYNLKTIEELKQTIRWLKDDYFPNKQPGDLDVVDIKNLKGMMRESEADRLWSLRNIPLTNIVHLRSKFYSGREFMKTPRYDMDVVPFIGIYNKIKPDIITVADDPQSAPPITHYRVLQIIAQGLRSKDTIQNPNLQLLGYRNVWFRYRVSEANVFVPITDRRLMAQKRAFHACFSTQKLASFPSPFYDGDFSSLTNVIQREQFQDLKILLGEEYFTKNSNPELKNAAGFVFLNQMALNDFYRRAEDLQPAIDLEEAYIASKK